MEQCLVLIKPDAIIKALEGSILNELAELRLEMVGAKVVQVTEELAKEHYKHLKEKPFFDELIKYIMGDLHKTKKILAFVYQGEGAIKKIRDKCGATNPEEAHPSSIRGKYGRVTTKGTFENIVHASENAKEAEREIKLWFSPDELTNVIFKTKKSVRKIESPEWM